MRRRWESLCSQAADSQAELSSHAGHWQQYQDAEQRVLPWLDHAERVLAEECGKTACQEDAQEQYDAHQVRKVEEKPVRLILLMIFQCKSKFNRKSLPQIQFAVK